MNVCLLLKSNSLTMYSTDVGEGKTATFSDQALKHLEVKNEEKFKDELNDFLSDLNPQEAILLLSEEVTFQKSIPLAEDYKQEKEEFFEKIPFSKKNVAKKELKTEKEIYFFSANQELYRIIIEACTHKGWSIDKVVPISVFPSVSQKTSLTTEEVSEILQSSEVLEKANLIDGEEYIVEEVDKKEEESEDEDSDGSNEEEEPKKSKFNLFNLLLGIIILLLLGGFAFAAYQFREGFKPKNPTEAQKIIEQSLQASPAASASASPTVQKEDLIVEVLNGSGVRGQAGTIASEMEKLGYKEVSTGNSPFDNQDATVVNFSSSVSQKDRDEIKGVLELHFGEIVTNEASSSAQEDISIITGIQAAN